MSYFFVGVVQEVEYEVELQPKNDALWTVLLASTGKGQFEKISSVIIVGTG